MRLPIRLGGLGIGTGRDEQGMHVVQLADLVYLTSRRATREAALGMLPGEHAASGSFESAAVLHLEPFVGPHCGTIKDATASLPSRDLLAFLHEKTQEVLLQQSDILNQARLRALATPWADGWLRATPSMAADSLLQSEVLRDAVRLRLGMPILDGGGCVMWSHAYDDRGYHCLACMASGHKQLMHNTLRNTVYRCAELADARLNLEPIGLLPSDPQFRPADVLIMTIPSIVASSWRQFPRLAFDCAIVSPFLATNLATSASAELSAVSSI